MVCFSEIFKEVQDPRSPRNQHHPFSMLIGTTLLASLSGIDSFSGIEDFVESHQDGLTELFEFPNGCPSHDTYQRMWDAISPQEFYNAFSSFVAVLLDCDSDIILIDGKTIRNSGSEKPFHIVSAWCHSNRLVLGQKKVESKSNEITAIPQLLLLLDLEGRLITIDAIGAQRSICDDIVSRGGDYLIALKGNQGSLHQDISLFLDELDTEQECQVFETNDKGHGRLEQRTAYVTDDIDWLQALHQWPGLQSVGKVCSKVTKKGKTYQETRYYISSLTPNAERLNHAARAHWSIENTLHWSLDVIFNEDKSCIRNDNAAENMDIARKWALNILQKVKEKPEQSIKSIMRKNSMSTKILLSNVRKIFHA